MKQVGNTILAKGGNHILAKRDNSAWPKGSKLSGFSMRQGKGKKDRYTLLSRPLMKKLTEYNRLYKPKVWLFEHRPGEPFTESIVSKRLKAAAREAGITKRIYPHLLRHSFATHLLEQGTDIKIVKELMGHNNIKTTERYVHIADTFKSNIKSPLDDLLMEEDEV